MQARLMALSQAIWIAVMLLAMGCGPSKQPAKQPQLQRVRVSQFHMGMMVHLTLWAPTLEAGRQAAVVAFQRIDQIDQRMSDYESESELSCLCRQAGQGPVGVSSELFEVLAAARRFAEWSDGRYDPTIGPLARLWRKARQTNTPPNPTAVAAALEKVGYEKLLLNADAQTVELTHPNMWLDLGSIAKGYAGDEAIRILREQGISCAAYEAGGDKVFGDAPPGQKGWQVEAEGTGPKLPPLANCAIGISSDSAQHINCTSQNLFVVQSPPTARRGRSETGTFPQGSGIGSKYNEKRVGHVLDPRTGIGFSSRTRCVVIASRGIDSDPLATLGTMMPTTSYQKLLKQHFPTARATVSESSDNDVPNPPRIPPPP